MRFIFVDSKHNFFHWLITVFLRIDFFIISTFISVYLFTVGFLLSQESIQSFTPPVWLETADFYTSQLPFFSPIEQLIFERFGDWYKGAPVWWTMVVGLPMIVMGISLLLINFFNLFFSIFSRNYNHTHCIFCRRAIRAKQNGFAD